MCIQKITYSITFLFLSLSGFYSQSFSVKVDENHTAVFSIYNEPFAATDSVQLINEQNNGNKYFTDQTPYFLISLNQQFFSNKEIQAISIDYNGKQFSFEGNAQIIATGLPPGKQEIKITATNSTMETVGLARLKFTTISFTPLFKNDAIAIGFLLLLLALIFYTSKLISFNL